MDYYAVLLLPAIWWLLWFFEPCSIWTNTLFLSHLKYKKTNSLFKEILTFTLIRAFTLSILWLTLAYIGRELFVFERWYFIILWIIYIILWISAILNTKYPIFKNISLQKLIWNNRKSSHLWMIFWLTIPACALPFVLILIWNATLSFSILEWFLSFFIFGLMLSLPLFYFWLSNHWIKFLSKIWDKLKWLPYLVWIIFIIIWILTISSNYWWK